MRGWIATHLGQITLPGPGTLEIEHAPGLDPTDKLLERAVHRARVRGLTG